MKKIKIKKGDLVKVIAGASKGKQGSVQRVLYKKNKAIVDGINIVKKHVKPNNKNPQGGIIEKNAPIHISNLSLLNSKGETTRVGYRMEGDKKVRYTKKLNEVI